MNEKNNKIDTYESPKQEWWQGRNDGAKTNQLRWWQHIQLQTLTKDLPDFNYAPVIIGFACDEGVARNKGRIGSAEGPLQLRKILSNVPIHHAAISIFDIGTIHCIDKQLEEAQTQLAQAVKAVLEHNGFPILLGGGHEIMFGHYSGITKYHKSKKVGIINFDAHLDLRKPGDIGVSSGTGFYQVSPEAQGKENEFLYLAIGIQLSGNTKELFDRADALKAEYVLAEDFHLSNLAKIKEQVQDFMAKTDIICLTIDLDVFSASIAPGVSAPTATGIMYDSIFREILKFLASHEKVVSLDIAEYNPKFDIDSRTAKLAAQFIFDWINWRYNKLLKI